MQNCKNIFKYNKQNELVSYMDISETGELINFYEISNVELTKFNVCYYTEKNKTYREIKKVKIIFGEACVLHHMFEDGDSRVVAIKKNSQRFEYPEPISKIYSHNDECIESYTINKNLIQDWLKKL